MQIKAKKKRILVGFYQEMIDVESRLHIIKGEFRYKYSPDQPRVPAGSPDGGQWISGGGGSSLDTGTQYADSGVVMDDAVLAFVMANCEQ